MARGMDSLELECALLDDPDLIDDIVLMRNLEMNAPQYIVVSREAAVAIIKI